MIITKNKAIASTKISLAAQVLRSLIQITSLVAISRLLSPEEVGIAASSILLTTILVPIKDIGLIAYTIQNKSLTNEEINNLHWINSFVGLVISGAIITISIPYSYFRNNYLYFYIFSSLSLIFLFYGLSAQAEAVLKRDFKFKELATIDLISNLVSVTTGIIIAYMGGKYWSMIATTVIAALTQSILQLRIAKIKPKKFNKKLSVKNALIFSKNMIIGNISGIINTNSTPLALTLLGNITTLGFFNRASTLSSITSTQITGPITTVAQSVFSKFEIGTDIYQRSAIKIISITSIICMYITMITALLADEIINILLGKNWADAANILRQLSVFSIVEPIASILAMLLISAGKSQELKNWKLFSLSITAISIIIGIQWGADGIIIGYAVSGIAIRLPILIYYTCGILNLSSIKIYKTLVSHIAMCAFVIPLSLITGKIIFDYSSISKIIIISLQTFFLYMGVGCLFKSIRHDFKEILYILFKRESLI